MRQIYTPLDLERALRKEMLRSDLYMSREEAARCFMEELKYRQKRFAKKKSTQHYDDWFYYITNMGRLARIRTTGKKPIGLKYLKNKTIYEDDYGLYRSDVVIPEGQIVKHRPMIEEIGYGWSQYAIELLNTYFDGGKACTMTIDRDFYAAYEPEYDWDFCLEGDLVTGKSCMSGNCDSAQDFYGGIDGCKVARFENEDGEQVGRCLVYEANGIRHFIRIYVQPDYGRCALNLVKQEMKEGDLFGRSQYIEGMKLKTNWDEDTETLYLDGSHYGTRYDCDEGCWVVVSDGSYWSSLSSTELETIRDMVEENGYYRCEYCGEWACDLIEVYNNYETRHYCCEDCANSDGFYRCKRCGSWERDENGYFYDDQFYCCEDCMRRDGYAICAECGEIIVIDDDDTIYLDGKYFCSEDCVRSNGYERCVDCGQWNRTRDLYECKDGNLRCRRCGEQRGLTLKFDGEIKEQNND